MLKIGRHVIVHSEVAAARISAMYGVSRALITVIPFVSYQSLTAASADISVDAARELLALPRSARVLLFVGRIEQYKGLNLLIRAFAEVVNRDSRATLVIAGRAADSIEQYTRLIAALGLQRATVVQASWLDDRQFGLSMTAADVVVLPYRDLFEIDQSAVAAAAMAYGRPVVATRVGGFSEQIHEGETGILVAPEDSAELAEALIDLLRDGDRRRRMGARAASLAHDGRARVMVGRRTLHVYQRASDRCAELARTATTTWQA